MPVSLSKSQHGYLVKLLKFFRSEIAEFSPIYFVEFEGIAAHDVETAMVLAGGYGNEGDRFLNLAGDSPPHTCIFYGPGDFQKSSKRFTEIAPKIIESMSPLLPPEHAAAFEELKRDSEIKQVLAVAVCIRESVNIARKDQPESLYLPTVARGKLFGGADNDQHFSFPNGKISHFDIGNFQKWGEVRAAVVDRKISVIDLQTPLMQSAANVIKHILDMANITTPSPRRKKRRRGDEHRADWYRDKLGIPVSRLDAARRDGRLDGEKRNGRWFYSLHDVKELWPDDFDETR